MPVFDETLESLREIIAERYGNVQGLADAMGIPSNRITRWFSGERSPKFKELAETLDFLGESLRFDKAPMGSRPIPLCEPTPSYGGEPVEPPRGYGHLSELEDLAYTIARKAASRLETIRIGSGLTEDEVGERVSPHAPQRYRGLMGENSDLERLSLVDFVCLAKALGKDPARVLTLALDDAESEEDASVPESTGTHGAGRPA